MTGTLNVTVLYIGSSLLAPLRNAERELNRDYKLNLGIAAFNFGSPLADSEWSQVDLSLSAADVVFVIHVMDGENAARLIPALEKYQSRYHALIVINCMPELMRRTRMGRLDVERLMGSVDKVRGQQTALGRNSDQNERQDTGRKISGPALRLIGTVGSWIGRQARGKLEDGTNGVVETRQGTAPARKHGHSQYLKLIDRLPGILRYIPTAGGLRDVKHYLNIFCYFLQPTPPNIRSMVLYALKEYVPDERLQKIKIKIPPPDQMPFAAIYHPDAPRLFETFESYETWYCKSPKSRVQDPRAGSRSLDPEATVGLLLMRPQVVSKTTKHYDALIHAIEAEGLSVIPALSTLMDNREAVSKFFVKTKTLGPESKVQGPKSEFGAAEVGPWTLDLGQASRVSQIASLTGFSFVGGPAMNDSEAAADFLKDLNCPYRSAVSLDTQTIDSWRASPTGLNPVQAGMQIAIPEIDGATEPFIYGGIPGSGVEPVPLDDRCARFARRLKRWNRLRTAPRSEVKLALVLFCFPPNKGNIGTAADLDVFPSVWDTLERLKTEGYDVELPETAVALRDMLIGGNAERFASPANVAYRMGTEEYRRLCPFVNEIEQDWGPAPGRINSFGGELLIQGVQLGNVFIGVQPTFGYEGDPMRLMMARSGAPHHGFMGFYTYLSKVLAVDALVHVGTHGALEFMPGKQIGLSGECWPDRLTGELPNIYIYSVNNPSEGSIAKRRSYAELVSYLTPPIENAGLYKELSLFKDLLLAYRQATDELERQRLYQVIQEQADDLHFASA